MKNQTNEIVPLPLQIEAFLNEEGYTTADKNGFPSHIVEYDDKIGIVWQEKLPKTVVISIPIPFLNKRIRIPRTRFVDGKKFLIGVLTIEDQKTWTIEGYGLSFFDMMIHPLHMLMAVKFGVEVYAELKKDEPEIVQSVAMFV